MKKMLVVLLCLFSVLNGFGQNKFKSYPENKTKDFQIILSNLKLNKEYKISDDAEKFKKILIGNWYEVEQDNLISIEKNGTCYFVYDYFKDKKQKKYFKIKGTWKIEKDSILLIPENKRRKTLKFEVDYFIVMKNEKSKVKKSGYQYTISIHMTEKTRVETELGFWWIHFDYLKKDAKQNK